VEKIMRMVARLKGGAEQVELGLTVRAHCTSKDLFLRRHRVQRQLRTWAVLRRRHDGYAFAVLHAD
jgi:hypothetical protein